MRQWLREYGWKFALAFLVGALLIFGLVELERRASGQPPLTGVGLVTLATADSAPTRSATGPAGAPTTRRVTRRPRPARGSAPEAAPSS